MSYQFQWQFHRCSTKPDCLLRSCPIEVKLPSSENKFRSKNSGEITVHRGMATEERLAHLDAALKDCIEQISSLQQEREMELDLREANKKLICSLVCKQELVDELERDKLQLEAELDALMTRLDSVEKENAFLKCECCALERELLLKLESASKVAKLEDECRQLRLLLRRNLPVSGATLAARENVLCSLKLKGTDGSKSVQINGSDLQLDCAPSDNALDCMQQGLSKNSLMNHLMKDCENQFESVGKQTAPGSPRAQGCWPWNVLGVILEEHQVSRRSINELLEEIKASLAPQSSSGTKQGESDADLNRSICRMMELIEEISPPSVVGSLTMDEDQCTDLDYSVHVLRWRNSELISILRNFVLSCALALNGSQGLDGFVMQLASVLEWAVGNCITLDDASRVRDRVRKHFNIDRSRSESQLHVTCGDCQNGMAKLQEENKWLKLKLRSLESANRELETKLSVATESSELLASQLQESRERIGRLTDLKGVMEDQVEHHKSINEDLDTQLTVAKVQQNEVMQRLSSLRVELEDKRQCCEDLETTCLELQLQLEILSRKGSPYLEPEQMGSDKQIGWEMMSDCSKLALMVHEPCKESGPREEGERRYSLRDRMFADEDTKTKESEVEHHPGTDANKLLALVPIKKQRGGFGFIRKMFSRRRKCSSSNKPSTLLQRNASTMMR